VQACSWISYCAVPGCAESCILNVNTNDNFETLQYRQYSEDSWQICPDLALWVNLTRPGDAREAPSRKLQGVRPTAALLCSQELSIAACIKRNDTCKDTIITIAMRVASQCVTITAGWQESV
jgi:hypothetical protein